MDHEGIVISGDIAASPNGDIRCYVLCIDGSEDQNNRRVLPLLEKAFLLPRDKMNAELSERKNIMRRLERPLIFGDVVNWRNEDEERMYNNCAAIAKFERGKKLIETRAHDGKLQFQLEGVINPADPGYLYSSFFPRILIPDAEEARRALPNCFFEFYVNISVSEEGLMLLEFDSFSKVSDWAAQENLGALPWNLNSRKYCCVNLPDDSDDDCLQLEETDCGEHPDLYDKLALVTGERDLFVESVSTRFMMPLLPRNGFVVGQYHSVHAVYNRFEDCYMVTESRLKRSLQPAPTDSNNRLRITVRAVDGMPGLYWDKTYGYLDDPEGVLKMVHLSQYANSSIAVSVVDGHPSRGGTIRFRIMDIYGDKAPKIAGWMRSAPIEVSKAVGVMVDDCRGIVFSAQHPAIEFHFDEPSGMPELGTHVKFSAVYTSDTQRFVIQDWRPLVEKQAVRCTKKRLLMCSPKEQQAVFCVTARVPAVSKSFDEMLYSEEFGLLDERGIIKHLNKTKKYTVWVTLSVPDVDSPLRPARTCYHVVSVGHTEPQDKVAISSFGLATRNSTLAQPESVENGVPKTSSRFSAPAAPAAPVSEKRAEATETQEQRPIQTRPTPSTSRFSTPRSEYGNGTGNEMPPKNARLFGASRGRDAVDRNDVVQFIANLRLTVDHLKTCKKACDSACPYLERMSAYLLEEDDRITRVEQSHPDLYAELQQQMGFD